MGSALSTSESGPTARSPQLVTPRADTPLSKRTFVWQVEGITVERLQTRGSANKLTSPSFTAAGKDWHVDLYLGETLGTAGHVGAFLVLETPDAALDVTYSFKCGGGPAACMSSSFCSRFSTREVEGREAQPGRGYGKWLSRAAIFDAPDEIIPCGVLTVIISVQYAGATCGHMCGLDPPPLPELGEQLGKLLSSEEGADVTLRCGGKVFRAHAFVLRLRSPFLKAAIDRAATSPPMITLPEIISPAILERVLSFLYSDTLEPASADEAYHLLQAADYLGVRRLMDISARAVHSSLSPRNAAVALALADQHNLGTLRSAAVRFIASHAVSVMDSPGWEHLKAVAPAAVVDVLRAVVEGAPQHLRPPGERKGRNVRQRAA